jgi:hypothetical protein
MKHLQLFEKWSANFHKTLQGAYAKAKETGFRHGKAAKDIEDYAKRNITTERFTIVSDKPMLEEHEFVISYNEKFLLEPHTRLYKVPTMDIVIHERGNKKLESLSEMPIQLVDGKLMDIHEVRRFRFKYRKELEDFIAMYVQALVSAKKVSELSPSTLAAAGYTDEEDTRITSSPTKNFLLKQINDVLQKDIRNLL